MRRITSLWLAHQAHKDLRKARQQRAFLNRRRQLIAARSRSRKLRSAGVCLQVKLERRNRARAQRQRDRYGPSQGLLININSHLRGEEGATSIIAMLIVVLAVLAICIFLLSIPLMLMLGVLNMFASKLFDLPGVKLLTNALTSIACADATEWIVDQLDGGILGGFLGWASEQISNLASGVTDLLGDNIFSKVLVFPLTAVVKMGDLFESVTKAAKAFQLMMCAIFDEKDGLLGTFKQRGYEQPLEAALSCSNWDPATMGPKDSESYVNTIDSSQGGTSSLDGQAEEAGQIDVANSKDGKPQFCLDGKKKNDAQGLVPAWLIPIYQSAAAEYELPWELLAAINWNDTSFGAKELNKKQKENKQEVDKKYSEDMTELAGLASPAITSDEQLLEMPIVKKLMPGAKPDEIREKAKAALESAGQVTGEWQQQNTLKLDRAGWIPLSPSEWKETALDAGNVPVDWESSPYPGTLDGSPLACPNPVDVDGNMVTGAPGSDGNADSPARAEMSDIGPYPGDDADKSEIAQWMADAARKVGIPGITPVMAALVESNLVNNPNQIDHDSTGFFQMRLSIHNNGRYKGYTENPKKQLLWFLDGALQMKEKYNGKVPTDDKRLGEFIAKIEKPAAQYEYRYGEQGDEARKLVKGSGSAATNAVVDVSFEANGDTDTCDPVDSIFALANWLSKRGASGDIWKAALRGPIQNNDETEAIPGASGPTFIEGDSLTVAAKDELKKRFGKDLKDKNFDAKDGRQVTEGISRIRARRKSLPGSLVFALGANSFDTTPKVYRGWIDQVMKIASGQCVVWPTVYANGPRQVSTMLKAKKKYSNLVVPRWDKIAAPYISDPAEHIHVNAAGDKAYAKMLRDAASSCSGTAGGKPKHGKLKGLRGDIYVDRQGSKLTMFSGASNYGATYHNKLGEIPRKGDPIEQDSGDGNDPYCAGGAGSIQKQSHRKLASNRYPGVAIKVSSLSDSRRTACGYWQITAPNGKSMIVMQSDVGPGAYGAHLDTNPTLAQELGYKTNLSFPTYEGLWSATYMGKKRPANVNKLISGAGSPQDMLQKKLNQDRSPPDSFRPGSVPPLKDLAKTNPDLPDASWVHSPAEPLKDKFPSFRSGLNITAQDGCSELVSKAQMGVFYSAAEAFTLPWQVLAAYAGATSHYGCQKGTYSDYKGSYATDADGSGAFDASDPVDAVFSTARSLYALGGKQDLAKAVRAMTEDRQLIADMADLAGQFGLDTGGFVELMDSNISLAVEKRDHIIDEKVCEGQEEYVECIAELYRRIKGVEASQAGKYLTGGCDAGSTPDVSLKPLTDKRIVKTKAVKKITGANGTFARKDALAGELAAIGQFNECNPRWKKNWKELNFMNDWGGELVDRKWGFYPNEHASHRNGADNDLNVKEVTDYVTGVFRRKQSIQMAKFVLRAGAKEIYFNDPGTIKAITADRKSAKDAEKKKLGSHWMPAPMYTQPFHDDHFHIRWNSDGSNTVPGDVKVWLASSPSDSSSSEDCGSGSGPYSATSGSGSSYVSCRNGKKPRVIVIHTTDGPYTSLDGLFKDMKKRGLSVQAANLASGKSARMVSDSYSAQHATWWNESSVGIEQNGYASKISKSEWLGSRRKQLNNTAACVAYWSQQFDIPLNTGGARCKTSGIKYNSKGIPTAGTALGVCAHGPVLQKNKNDPGSSYPWDEMINQAKDYVAAGKYKSKDPSGNTPSEPGKYDPAGSSGGGSGGSGGGSGGSGGGSGGGGSGGSGGSGGAPGVLWPFSGLPRTGGYSQILMERDGPIPAWCYWHYKKPGCGSTVMFSDYKKRARMIMTRAHCKNFRGKCGQAVRFLVDAQRAFVKQNPGASTSSSGKAKPLGGAPSNPYWTE